MQMFPSDFNVIHLYTNMLGGSSRWLDSLAFVDDRLAAVETPSVRAMLYFLRAQVLVAIVKYQHALVNPGAENRTCDWVSHQQLYTLTL